MFDRARSFYGGADDITRIIALVAFVILIIIALPSLAPQIPGFANGATCTSLTSPNGGGSNQSLLAANADPNSLRLELTADKVALAVGEPLNLNVRFINDSSAPLTLAIVPEEAVFRYTGNENGILFFVQAAGNPNSLGESAAVKAAAPIRQQFPPNLLHILGPRQHCTQPISIAPNRLAAAGMGAPNQYQIIAAYRNNYRGVLAAPGQRTPTPVFRDQGVWTTPPDGVRSNNLIITVGAR